MNMRNKIVDYFSQAEYNIFRVQQLASFGIMTTLLIIYLMLIRNSLDDSAWKHFWKMSAIYLMPPAGKESTIPLGLYNNLSPFLVGISIIFFDIVIALGTLSNWWLIEGVIKHLPKFKYHDKEASAELWLHKIQEKSKGYRERKSHKFMVPLTIFAFYLIPFQGGSISTSIICTLLGYKWRHILTLIGIASTVATILWILAYYGVVKLI